MEFRRRLIELLHHQCVPLRHIIDLRGKKFKGTGLVGRRREDSKMHGAYIKKANKSFPTT